MTGGGHAPIMKGAVFAVDRVAQLYQRRPGTWGRTQKGLDTARSRHKQLESRDFRVPVVPIIFGSSGMIRMETKQYFAALGLTATKSLSLMQEYHDTAIKYLS